jgi:hypothetical protein
VIDRAIRPLLAERMGATAAHELLAETTKGSR